jgi:hypothetical protein
MCCWRAPMRGYPNGAPGDEEIAAEMKLKLSDYHSLHAERSEDSGGRCVGPVYCWLVLAACGP